MDYFVADRSAGFAPADVRFAQWAKWCELITPHQYELAFIKQNAQIQEGEPPQPVHEIMTAEGWINQEQAVRLLEFLCRSRPNENDALFVETLLTTQNVDRKRVQQVQQLQAKAASRYHEVPPLCQLLIERRVISEAQMLAVLKILQNKGQGNLKMVYEMVVKPTKRTRWGDLSKTLSLRNPRNRNVVLIITLFVVGLGIWRWQTAGGASMVYVQCKHCGKISEIEWSKTYPVRCPVCSTNRAYYALICADGHIFGVENPFIPHSCPECGTSSVRPLREEDLP